MKLKVGDSVMVTAGKDKGMIAKVMRVVSENQVVVQGANMYTKSIKPMMGRPGERIRKERALDVAKVAIYNPDTKKVDRVGYQVKDGQKVRVYKKTGKTV